MKWSGTIYKIYLLKKFAGGIKVYTRMLHNNHWQQSGTYATVVYQHTTTILSHIMPKNSSKNIYRQDCCFNNSNIVAWHKLDLCIEFSSNGFIMYDFKGNEELAQCFQPRLVHKSGRNE